MIQAQILELLAGPAPAVGPGDHPGDPRSGRGGRGMRPVLVMYGGVTAEYADVDTIYNAPQHPYTQDCSKPSPICRPARPNWHPSPATRRGLDALPPGCRFAPRCPRWPLIAARSSSLRLYDLDQVVTRPAASWWKETASMTADPPILRAIQRPAARLVPGRPLGHTGAEPAALRPRGWMGSASICSAARCWPWSAKAAAASRPWR